MILSDRIVSLLRTVVPALWGSLVAWLLTVVSLPDVVTAFLSDEAPLVTVLAIAGWYALARWMEPRLPAWLTRVVLGSNAAPTYAPVSADVTSLPSLIPQQKIDRWVRDAAAVRAPDTPGEIVPPA